MTRSILFLVKIIISLLLGFFHSKINVPIPYVATWMALQYIFGRNTEQEENRRPEHRSSWLRLAVTFYIGYVSGEMEVPIGIFLIGLFVYWWLHPEDQTRSEKEEDIQVTALVDQNEEEDKSEGISQHILPEIARILNTTDEDARIEDLNKIVIELWPYFGQYIKNLLVDWYEPMICRKCKSFRFTRVDMGEKVPVITDARLHITEKKQVVLDLDLSYDGNASVKISLGRRYFRVGAKQMAIVGTLRVVLTPLMDEIPLFGSLTWFLPRRPVSHQQMEFGTTASLPAGYLAKICLLG
ncbi:extended synaptotagmin-3-like [Xenopus laevis]|uniref:Extended synaptotagmin-3-like n=1 Tax=Xenopus laevis TaxID=8355 RepID=A0A8J1KRT2_XENLA|nr:extended synaptotagmin-3-like [Xenopus laevis]